MDRKPSLRKNFLMNALLSASSFLFPLITYPYVTRILMPDGMGKVTFAISFVAYFGMIARLGIPTYGVRACARVRDDRRELSRVVQELLLINFVMGAAAYAALGICIAAVPRVRADRLLFEVISITIFLDAIGMEWLYKGLEQYSYITIRSLIFKAVAAAATFLLIQRKEDVVLYGGISIFASSASNILNFVNAHKYIDLKPCGGYRFRRHLKAVAIFFAMACATTIYTNLDAVMLGFMKTDSDVGYYNAAVKIKTVLVSMVTALGAVLLPRSSYYVEHGKMDAFHKMAEKAIRFVILMAAPLMVYFLLFAQEGILLLSGKEFLPSIRPMQILMPTVLMIGITNVLGIQILVPLGREKTVLYSELTGAAVDLVLNILLIPGMGAAGAAIGTLVAEAAVLAVQYGALRKDIQGVFRGFPWLKLCAAAGLGICACLWVRWVELPVLISLGVSFICFMGVYGGYLFWRKEELITDAVKRAGRAIGKIKHKGDGKESKGKR